MEKSINTFSGEIFKEMANMVESTSLAINMIDSTPAVHNYDFTMTAVRELLNAINESSFNLMMVCASYLGVTNQPQSVEE